PRTTFGNPITNVVRDPITMQLVHMPTGQNLTVQQVGDALNMPYEDVYKQYNDPNQRQALIQRFMDRGKAANTPENVLAGWRYYHDAAHAWPALVDQMHQIANIKFPGLTSGAPLVASTAASNVRYVMQNFLGLDPNDYQAFLKYGPQIAKDLHVPWVSEIWNATS